MKRFTGLMAATFTPMDSKGQVDLAPIPAIVEALIERGVKGLYICGSTGEGPSLTTAEREVVAKAYVDAARGRIGTMVQVGHNSVEDARQLGLHAQTIGADAISAVSPSYFKPENVCALVETLAQITDAVPQMPFYYYHIPQLSGLSIDPVAFLRTAPARIPSLEGIKFSSRDVDVMHTCLAHDNGRYNILFGVDEMLLSGLAVGVDGAVGSTYNFLAPLFNKVIADFERGDIAAARAGQLKATQLIGAIVRYHGVSGLKAAMSLTGAACGPTRYPLSALTEEETARMRQELEALDFLAFTRGS